METSNLSKEKEWDLAVKKFKKKYLFFKDTDFYYLGSVVALGDFYFDIKDVFFATTNRLSEKKLFEWYDKMLELAEENIDNPDIIDLKLFIKTNQ